MENTRRAFISEAMLPVRKALGLTAAALVLSRCTQQGSLSPTAPSPAPQHPTSDRGTWYRGGVAQTGGTLEQALSDASLRPGLNRSGLVVTIQGRTAPAIAGWPPENGYYFFLVNGRYIGSGSAREIQLRPGDRWDAFDWNGRT